MKFHKGSVCICFNCMQFENFMRHSLVGCWVCYSMFHRENESVLSCSMPFHGWSGMLQHGCFSLDLIDENYSFYMR
jgi:protein-arginine kinase activator protein McsA